MPFRLPDDPEMASKVMEFRQTRMERILEAGVIGYLIGRGENRPAGIVVLVLFICFALIAVVLLFVPAGSDLPRKDIILALISLSSFRFATYLARKTRVTAQA